MCGAEARAGAGVWVLGSTEPCGKTDAPGPCQPFSLRSTMTLGEFVNGSSGLKKKKSDKALSCVCHELGDVCPNFQLLPGALHNHLPAVLICHKAPRPALRHLSLKMRYLHLPRSIPASLPPHHYVNVSIFVKTCKENRMKI